jgi:hypothetical protein
MTDQPPPLLPRAERCPEPECTDEKQCWRCDYEESQHATATAIAAGYCPHCGSGDAGPTPEAYEELRQRAEQAEARTNDALKRALADANRHELDGRSETAAGLRIAARHLLAGQKETRP